MPSPLASSLSSLLGWRHQDRQKDRRTEKKCVAQQYFHNRISTRAVSSVCNVGTQLTRDRKHFWWMDRYPNICKKKYNSTIKGCWTKILNRYILFQNIFELILHSALPSRHVTHWSGLELKPEYRQNVLLWERRIRHERQNKRKRRVEIKSFKDSWYFHCWHHRLCLASRLVFLLSLLLLNLRQTPRRHKQDNKTEWEKMNTLRSIFDIWQGNGCKRPIVLCGNKYRWKE